MKYGVSLYSYYGALNKKQLKEEDLIRVSKELGFDAIEIVDFVNFACETDESPQKAKWLREEANKYGLEISSFAIGSDFLNGSEGNVNEEIKRVKSYVDIAELLGVKKMRIDVTRGYAKDSGVFKSFDTLLPALADACREIAEYAQPKGILIMTENHGFFSQDSDRVEKLYSTVNHENFALLCDIGNFTCADEDPVLAVARVAPYSRYVHVKDFIIKGYNECDPGEGSFKSRAGNYLRGTIIGHGNVPVKQCMRLIKETGYDDTISIEFEGMESYDDALRIGLDNLKKYWSEI